MKTMISGFAIYSISPKFGRFPGITGGSRNSAAAIADMIPDHREDFLRWSEAARAGDIFVKCDTCTVACVQSE